MEKTVKKKYIESAIIGGVVGVLYKGIPGLFVGALTGAVTLMAIETVEEVYDL